jgi:hypothetical protein
MKRPIIALSVLAVLLMAALPVSTSAAITPYDAKAFADAQAAGRSIVIAVNADW